MFGNFIYFIVVLLIYLTYQPTEETNFSGFQTLALFVVLSALFCFLTRLQFKLFEKKIEKTSFARLDHRFNLLLTRQTVLAIMLFALDIYGLNLPSFLINIPLFAAIPTLQALLFLGLFVFYLALVWTWAHGAYQKLYRADIARRSYVASHISFSVPVLLPWLMLSGVADIINALPFDVPKRFLATTEGEAIYFLFFLLAIVIVGPALIQKFWRCTPLEEGPQRQRIEILCERAKLAYADIMYWPIFGGRMITAGVMGLIKRFRYILVTESLLQLLEPDEIEAVIAHEIGHVKKKHLLFYLVFFVGYMLLTFASFDIIIFSIIYADPVYWLINNSGFSPSTMISTISSVIIILIFLIYFRYIFGFFMRNFERQADAYVYRLFDSAGPLISTLEKIALTSGQPPDKPNWHHFSIAERISFLQKCEISSRWIIGHEHKIKKSIAVYLAALILVGGSGYYLNAGAIRNRLNTHFLEKVLRRQIEKSPDNARLFSVLGDLYYSSKDYAGVRSAYEKSLSLAPDNAKVLNNLAWLYATCEDKRFLDPARALMLAKRAVRLEHSPQVWDTLAESYYVNGMIADAVRVGQRALAMAKSNRAYYRRQLAKFEQAAK